MSQDILNLIAAKANVTHLAEYFGLWSILEDPFQSAVAKASTMNLQTHITANQRGGFSADANDAGYMYRVGGIAVIGIAGPLMKHVSSLTGGTSSILTRRRVRNAAADKLADALVLKIDSPGGTVAGTFDLADDVAAAAKKKPVVAYIEDLGASAAYAIASQARKIYANKTALVGSIGTYGVICDESKRAEKMGITVHVLRAGKFKGAGEPGTEITEEQLGEWQKIVDQVNEPFLIAVARGRQLSLERVRQLADGRVHIGEAAIKVRLIDQIRTFDSVLHELRKETEPKGQQQQIALPAVSQASSVNSTRPAHAAPTTSLPSEKEKRMSSRETQQQADKAAINQFNAEVGQRMESGMDRRRAVMSVARANPELHKAYLRATNRNRPHAVSQLD